MNYYISDLHLFHEAAIRFDDRPFRDLEEMHTEIVKRWNEKVNNGDTVYILGDVSMRGKNENLIALVAILKGKKVLIRGNHDDVSDLRYRQLFSEVCDYKEIRDSIAGSKIRLPSSCSMPLCKGSKPAQYSIREIFFIRLVSSCAILFASKVVEKL